MLDSIDLMMDRKLIPYIYYALWLYSLVQTLSLPFGRYQPRSGANNVLSTLANVSYCTVAMVCCSAWSTA